MQTFQLDKSPPAVEGRALCLSSDFDGERVLQLRAAVTLMLRCGYSRRPVLSDSRRIRMLSVFGSNAYSKGINLGLTRIAIFELSFRA